MEQLKDVRYPVGKTEISLVEYEACATLTIEEQRPSHNATI